MSSASLYNYYHISAIKLYDKLFDKVNFVSDGVIIIYLYGSVGSGKTTFVKSYLNYLDKNTAVTSPTFSLVNEYLVNNIKVFHYDLYRIETIKELFEIGLDYYFEQEGLHFIEWPDKFIHELPESNFDICLNTLESSRLVKIYDKT